MKLTVIAKDLLKYRQLFILSFPGILFLFIFNYIPLYGLILPFKNFRYDLGFFKSPWAGLGNFKFLFNSQDALTITRNTVLYNLAFIITLLIISVSFAVFLNELSRNWVKLYQTLMFFPFFMSWVVVSYIFLAIFDMEHGLANHILAAFGKDAILWYNEPSYWPVLLVASNTWKGAGYLTVIYYAGLLGINDEYYAAARIDGANKWQQITRISLPLIRPLIIIMIILQIGKIFYGNFDLFYNLPRDAGALYSTTDVIDTYVFRALRSTGDIGMASAAGAYQSVVGFLIVMAANLTVKKISPENALF